jgi:hypothetical protein
MQLLCTSDSVAFIQSLRIALEGEYIDVHCSDMLLNPWGPLGPVGSAGGRIYYVMKEEDWSRAVEILRELSTVDAGTAEQNAAAPGAAASGASKWIMIVVIATVIGAVLLGSGS